MTTVTLRALIESLQEAEEEHGPDVPIVFSSDYGDLCHTQQAHSLDGNVKVTSLKESGYSCSGYRITDEDDDDHDGTDESSTEQESPKYLLIS